VYGLVAFDVVGQDVSYKLLYHSLEQSAAKLQRPVDVGSHLRLMSV